MALFAGENVYEHLHFGVLVRRYTVFFFKTFHEIVGIFKPYRVGKVVDPDIFSRDNVVYRSYSETNTLIDEFIIEK